jgi:NADPH:quinone reductase
MKAMRIHANGGPEVLREEDITLAPPGPGEATVRHTAISLNFSDINVRRGGFYIANPLKFPVILGNEGAGVVSAIGPGLKEGGVTNVAVGDRVAYVGSGGPFYENTGSYAEARNLPARVLVKLPDGISEEVAAACMLKGLTASMVINRVYKPKPGDVVLIHAAASGVGLLLVQWCKHLGATVIGTVGSKAKADVIRTHGAAHAVLYREADFVAEVKKIAPKGVHAVLDGVGKDTFEKSLDVTRPFGVLCNYGNASGHPDPLDLLLLAKKGSLLVSRPAFSTHIADPADYKRAADEMFDLIERGILKVEIGKRYKLSEAAQAHRDIEAGALAGAGILVP